MNAITRNRPFQIVGAIGVVACSILVHVHVWEDIFAIAVRDPEASHILLVPLMVAYLAWNRRDCARQLSSAGYLWGLFTIVTSIGLHLTSLCFEFIIGWHASAVLGVIGGLMFVGGIGVIKRFAPAIFALWFLVPIPGLVRQQLSTPVQLACARIAADALSPLGLDIGQHGCLLTVNGTDVAIAEACNGMRMLFGVMVVVYTVAFSMPIGRRLRLGILLMSPVAAIVLNLVRLLGTVAMFGITTESNAQAFHDINGWLFPCLIMFVAVVSMERNRSPNDGNESASVPEQGSFGKREHPFVTCMGAALLLVFPALQIEEHNTASRIAEHRESVRSLVSDIPFAVDDWLAIEAPLHPQEIELLRPLAAFRRTYVQPGDDSRLTVFVLACEQARDLVGHEPGICFTRQGWELKSQEPASWSNASGTIDGRDYRFLPETDSKTMRRVASILATYGRPASGDPEVVAAAASDFQRNHLGAVAIQLVYDVDITNSEWHELTSQFVESVRPLLGHYDAIRRDKGETKGIRRTTSDN